MQIMLNEQEVARLRPIIWQVRIIVGAMFLGVMAFAVITAVIQKAAFVLNPKPDMLSFIGLGMALMNVPLSIVLPMLLGRASLPKSDSPDLGKVDAVTAAAGKIVQSAIISCALLEGAAFTNLAAAFTSPGGGLMNWTLGVALGVMLFVQFPFTEGGFIERVEKRLSRDGE